ncbi:MAG: hypothetical protein NZ654_16245 [Acidimicrobiales bacterium]|nr:hypothetical protein [Acidimicrobiales bacterium]
MVRSTAGSPHPSPYSRRSTFRRYQYHLDAYPLRAKVDEIEMDVAARYAETEELHRKVAALLRIVAVVTGERVVRKMKAS